jgi:metallo-beta-lactamase family protein
MKLRFLGAAGTVTGSRYLLEHEGTRILIDCGLFQGVKNIRRRNWAPFPGHPERIDAVVLTHAHLDHSGYLPKLMREGFHGPVYCSGATAELVDILLEDSAHIQEEDARHANRHGYSKHHPAEPLYTAEDARKVMKQFRPVEFDHDLKIGTLTLRLSHAGHILGAACVRIEGGGTSITFSGDVGRPNDLVMKAPVPLADTDYLVVESTYGDRCHPESDTRAAIAAVVNATLAKGGTVLMPAFAVGRAQLLTHVLTDLMVTHELAPAPIFLDSPMAIDVAPVFHKYRAEHRLSDAQCERMCASVRYMRSVEDSRELSANRQAKIIIAGAGMLNGGRILHQLKAFGGDSRNTLVITGYQAEGTRGDALLRGNRYLRIHGEEIAINCRVEQLENLSGHADYRELLDWLRPLRAPRRVFVTHGEPVAADSLRQRLEHELHWSATVPEQGDEVELA